MILQHSKREAIRQLLQNKEITNDKFYRFRIISNIRSYINCLGAILLRSYANSFSSIKSGLSRAAKKEELI